ncbi:MAG: DUF308 domain-containing protein [Mycoplasmatota bacterium]|nr:DUF308 domain-containing protein [Mycoplasmatota bacterium]
MLKKINNFINSSILVSVLFILLGLGMILFPNISLTVVAYSIAIMFIVLGIYFCVIDYRFFLDTLVVGILTLVLGILLLVNPSWLSNLIPMVMGVWFIVDSILKIRISLTCKEYDDVPWVMLLILSIISLICGILFILHPLITSNIVMTLLGVIIVVYAISDIADMIVAKKYINEIAKGIKKTISTIEL